jgi:hypothetical protein
MNQGLRTWIQGSQESGSIPLGPVTLGSVLVCLPFSVSAQLALAGLLGHELTTS